VPRFYESMPRCLVVETTPAGLIMTAGYEEY